MLWVTAFHIIFVIAWFAGMLYLPRLFVYHSLARDTVSRERFVVMETKLFAIMSIGGVGALLCGLWLLHDYAWNAYGDTPWLRAKLVLVVGLIAYHLYCGKLMRDLKAGTSRHGHRFFRIINEIPAVAMVAVVILVVVKIPV